MVNGTWYIQNGSRVSVVVRVVMRSCKINDSIQTSLRPKSDRSTTCPCTVILTPLVSLDTPGKATVEVVILADPDGHEICFVGDEAFRELSQVDPKSDQLLSDAMAADKSDEWFAKHNKQKAEA